MEVNNPPQVATPSSFLAHEGINSVFSLSSFGFSDQDNDPLTFWILFENGTSTTSYSWISLDGSTLDLTIEPPADSDAVLEFVITVSDSINDPVSTNFIVSVDFKPIINQSVTKLGIITPMEYSEFHISGSLFSDEDSDLTYDLSKLSRLH